MHHKHKDPVRNVSGRWLKRACAVVGIMVFAGNARAYDMVYPTDDTYICSALSNGYLSCQTQTYDNDLLRVAYMHGSYFYSSFIKFPRSAIETYCGFNISQVELVLTLNTVPSTPSVTVVRFRHLNGWDWNETTLTGQTIQDYLNQYGWSAVRDFITTLSYVPNPTVIDITPQFQAACSESTALTIALEGDYSGTDYSFAWWDREAGGTSQGPFLRIYYTPPGPDLRISTMSQTLHTGSCGTQTLRVINSGNVDAGPFTLSVSMDSRKLLDTIISGLAAGDTQIIQFPIYTITGGNHVLIAKVDTANAVPESDESNNEVQVNITSLSRNISYPFSIFSGGESDPTNDFYLIAAENPDSFRVYFYDSLESALNVAVVDIDFDDSLLFVPSQGPTSSRGQRGKFLVFRISQNGVTDSVFSSSFPYVHTVLYDPLTDSVWVGGQRATDSLALIRIYKSSLPFSSSHRDVVVGLHGQITEILIDDHLTPNNPSDDTVYIAVFETNDATLVGSFPRSAMNGGFVDSTSVQILKTTNPNSPNPSYLEVFPNVEGGILYGAIHVNRDIFNIPLYSPCDSINPVVYLNMSFPTEKVVQGIAGMPHTYGIFRFLVSTSSGLFLVKGQGDTLQSVVPVDTSFRGLLLRVPLSRFVPVGAKEIEVQRPSVIRAVRILRVGETLRLPGEGVWRMFLPDGRMQRTNSPQVLFSNPGTYTLQGEKHIIRILVLP